MFTSKIGRPLPTPAARCDLFVVHTVTSPHSGSPHMIYKKLPNPEIVSLIAEELFHMHCNHYLGLWPARLTRSLVCPSWETQGQSVGLGEKARRKFFSSGEGAPGYRLSPDHFQKFKRMPAPDWAQKNLCIIVPNPRTASPEFFLCVRTRRLLSRHTCLVRSPRLCVQFAREICPFCFPKQKRRSYR